MRKSHFPVAAVARFLVAVLACSACGGSSSSGPGGSGPGGSGSGGSGSVNGTVGGASFVVASQLAFIGPADTSSSCTGPADGGVTCTTKSSGQGVIVVLMNRPNVTCALLRSLVTKGTALASLDVLALEVGNDNGDLAAGTYDLPSGVGQASFDTFTSTCATGLYLTATGGTITLSQMSSAGVAGTYAVTFGTQGTFTGSFNVTSFCDEPDAGSASAGVDAGPPVCEP
jgi:hypothetical protein